MHLWSKTDFLTNSCLFFLTKQFKKMHKTESFSGQIGYLESCNDLARFVVVIEMGEK